MEIHPSLMIDLSHEQDSSSTTEAFAKDVADGLNQHPKTLPSRYFYDGNGSRLFQEIMDLPEYYLTRTEFEILNTYKDDIASCFSSNGFFHLIDLGAGDALKTKIILKQLQQEKSSFEYVPIDISKDAMRQLSDSLPGEIPEIEVQAVVGEYFEALEWLHQNKPGRKVVLFLGSNIGNFEPEEANNFLKSIRLNLEPSDMLLMGIDLRKDPNTIIPAYDDAAGVTAAFNLNLLERINRELEGNFDLAKFKHYAYYEPQAGAMKSYVISTEEQQVTIPKIGKTYHFDAWEAIHTENSHKYSLLQIERQAKECGFKKVNSFQDQHNRFADVLFEAV